MLPALLPLPSLRVAPTCDRSGRLRRNFEVERFALKSYSSALIFCFFLMVIRCIFEIKNNKSGLDVCPGKVAVLMKWKD